MIQSIVPTTVDRVTQATSQENNEAIRRETELRVHLLAQSENPRAIQQRLEELDREWDIERTLEANAAIASLAGLTLGSLVDKRFFILPAAVATFLFQHAVQGWCPPLPLFRRLGIRTSKEIDRERFALKAIRGDFEGVYACHHTSDKADRALQATKS
jgi:hypothetical protein